MLIPSDNVVLGFLLKQIKFLKKFFRQPPGAFNSTENSKP